MRPATVWLRIWPLAALVVLGTATARERWSQQQAADWYGRQPWILGANYIPASAINQLEMWQAETFDPQRIDLELGWAEAIGMNTMRVFLHDLLWRQDAPGLTHRLDTFLAIAARHHMRILLVLFDSVWDPRAELGKQHAPVAGVHNSGWVQSPSATVLSSPAEYPRLEAYVRGIVGAFATDERVLGWDLWNEPPYSDEVGGNYAAFEAREKGQKVRALLPRVYAWARAAGATQPLTSGLWGEAWQSARALPETATIQLQESDVLSFHSYDKPAAFEREVIALGHHHRPLICTEYMARTVGSTFEGTLPLAHKYHVGAINWGLVAGKTQTIYPWDSWQKRYTHEPTPWFHDIFRADGRPYDPKETSLIRAMSGTKRSNREASSP
ncbi:MAG: cellulase family glycosylhydrolase [Gammaproteobacteria bacterium]|nr:cellulase family glycosylhydrolase [Gammaproteobacteria bacterium]